MIFSTSKGSEALDLNLSLSDNFSGIGFDSLVLEVNPPERDHPNVQILQPDWLGGGRSVLRLSTRFTLGNILASVQSSVSLSYDLTFNAGTQANVGDGFGFAYPSIADPRLTGSVPEPSTWAMMGARLRRPRLRGFIAGRARVRRRLSIAQDEDLR